MLGHQLLREKIILFIYSLRLRIPESALFRRSLTISSKSIIRHIEVIMQVTQAGALGWLPSRNLLKFIKAIYQSPVKLVKVALL